MESTTISNANAEVPKDDDKAIILSPNSVLDQHIIDSLDELFEFVPPKKLKQHIMNVFLHLLTHDPSTPGSFKDIAEAYFLLFNFLDLVDSKITAGDSLQQQRL